MSASPKSLLDFPTDADRDAAGRVFASAAELFGVLSTPLRLRILNAICTRELGVNDIVDAVRSTQPNVSQHLKILYLAGIVEKRREGNQIYYRVHNEHALRMCRMVCTQIAIELDEPGAVPVQARLANRRPRAA